MQLSHSGLEFLKDQEGFKAKAYKDGGGVWTIGYGTTRINGKPVEEGMTCTESEALLWLAQDTASAQTLLNKSVRVPLRQGQFDALVSFVYNIGEDAFSKSTLLRMLNMGDYMGAYAQFSRWDMDGGKVVLGLTKRRMREQSLFIDQT